MSNNKSIMYSALEVAGFCGVVNQTAINWIRNGYLKAFTTPGGQFRIYPDDLITFMRERDMRIPEAVLNAAASNAEESEDLKTVLVVDDDASLNDILCTYLRKKIDESFAEGYKALTVVQAYDGFDAGSKMAVLKPAVVVLDLDLPGIDGFDLCRRIKEDSQYEKPSVIIVTALEDSGTEEKCRELGVTAYFKKPVSFSELWECICTELA